MTKTRRPRLRVPAVMAISGSATAVAAFVGRGWGAAFGVEVLTLVMTLGYYKLGGRDSDLGAILGSRADERQTRILVGAMGFAFVAMEGVAFTGYAIAIALRDSTWPFLLFAYVGLGSFIAWWVILRRRG